MQLRKFYGRTVGGAMAQIKKEIGPDALIIETNTLKRGSRAARYNPGARFEITVAGETPTAARLRKPTYGEVIKKRAVQTRARKTRLQGLRRDPQVDADRELVEPKKAVRDQQTEPLGISSPRKETLLHDFADLKSQIQILLDDAPVVPADVRDQIDLNDYRYLSAQGIDRLILARSFRRWLEWRTGVDAEAVLHPPLFDPAQQMKGDGLREWLWNEWSHHMFGSHVVGDGQSREKTQIVGLVGAHGVGKSTTLAKLASKYRQNGREKVAVLSLDGVRIGADEQWKRYSQLMDIEFILAVTPEDTMNFINRAERFDWVGIDTPGEMKPDSGPGRLYGSLLAHFPQMKTDLALDVLSKDEVNREQIRAMQPFQPRQLIFTKVDQASRRGSLLNLTMDGAKPIDRVTTGSRVPEDMELATPTALWRWVFEGADEESSTNPRVQEGALL